MATIYMPGALYTLQHVLDAMKGEKKIKQFHGVWNAFPDNWQQSSSQVYDLDSNADFPYAFLTLWKMSWIWYHIGYMPLAVFVLLLIEFLKSLLITLCFNFFLLEKTKWSTQYLIHHLNAFAVNFLLTVVHRIKIYLHHHLVFCFQIHYYIIILSKTFIFVCGGVVFRPPIDFSNSSRWVS